MYQIYEVKEGQTLQSIANEVGSTVDDLINLNGLNTTSNLTPGTFIIIPSSNMIFEKYIVKKGDNIYAIARSKNIDPNQLLRLNGLNKDEYIYPGQEIIIPKSGTKFHITEIEDTLDTVSQKLNTNPNSLNNQNKTIYLVPDQLIISKM